MNAQAIVVVISRSNMKVKEPTLVIVRGINSVWIEENFTKMVIYFGGSPVGVPKKNANYIGLYIESPISAITHIGIVDKIEKHAKGKNFFLKALVKLDSPIRPQHQIRKHEYWYLEQLGLRSLDLVENHL